MATEIDVLRKSSLFIARSNFPNNVVSTMYITLCYLFKKYRIILSSGEQFVFMMHETFRLTRSDIRHESILLMIFHCTRYHHNLFKCEMCMQWTFQSKLVRQIRRYRYGYNNGRIDLWMVLVKVCIWHAIMDKPIEIVHSPHGKFRLKVNAVWYYLILQNVTSLCQPKADVIKLLE